MKNKIDSCIVRFAIWSCPFTIAISIVLLIVSVINKLPYNNFDLIGAFGIIIMILSTCWFNNRHDYIYNLAMRRSLSEEDISDYRLRSLSFCFFLGSLFIFVFSTITVGHPMTHPSANMQINHQTITGFHFVNILRSNTFK